MSADPVTARLQAQRDRVLDELMTLLRFPSVSADPAFAQGMAEATDWLQTLLEQAGFRGVRRLQAGGHPSLYAETAPRPGLPTILIYGHYDVQPPDPLESWTSPPFAPDIRDGRLYARGVTDMKGALVAVLAVLRAFLQVEGQCPVNIKLLLEGEEETGSATLERILRENLDLLRCDAVISADGMRAEGAAPSFGTGCRGNSRLSVTLRTATGDLHSGRYGGAVRNAVHELSRLIASLHDADGRIQVPDFQPPPGLEPAPSLPVDPGPFYAGIGAAPFGDPAIPLAQKLTVHPSIDCNGITGGYTGAGSKTIVPATATAKFTLRHAYWQSATKAVAAFRRHLEAQCGAGVEIAFTRDAADVDAYVLPRTHPLFLAAQHSLTDLHGHEAAAMLAGGTVPVIPMLKALLGVETLMLGVSAMDERAHAPDEFLRLSSFDEALANWPAVLRALGRFPPAAFASCPT
ncbi:MAG: M20/M25/M40 family metallo-hydrolase [Rhodobacter sp.]|nr:M20/M25/M40 family metallo-hydrolase [Paracoccaceae bacterium]MCC0077337.1 M20/M25/M40 family metallo-hydrolase [Rhodobacter sp.]